MATKPSNPKEAPVDPDYGIDESAEVDNTLPGEPLNVDNSLPAESGNVDNSLPEGPEVIFPGANAPKTLPPSVATRYKVPQGD